MAGRREALEIANLANLYIRHAEQERIKAMEIHRQLEEVLMRLDKLRRNLLFVDKGHEGLLELASLLMDMERLRRISISANNRLKLNINVAVTYVISVFECFQDDIGQLPLIQMGNTLRHAHNILRSTKDLNIDFSEMMAAVSRLNTIQICLDRTNMTASGKYFFQQANQLINTLGW